MGIVYSSVRKPMHFMVMYKGFGISDVVLKSLKEEGCVQIRIIYEGVKGVKTYVSNISQWFESSLTYTFEEDDPQTFLAVANMEEARE